ncbi:TonB-dependent receptor [Pseudomonas sp. NFXW11]|uniref:TonB-dependent receptor n=1 Tax=Pseudomonas sp. NFXW11 TaxID=2819531 RepID=UPI003CF0788E
MLVARFLRPDRPLTPVIRSALLGLVLGCGVGLPLLAAEPQALDSRSLRSYNIAPGPLGPTLSSLAVDAGMALSFQPELTEGLSSPSLNGRYTPQEAASRLLDGSGLGLLLRSDGSYTLVQRRITLEDTQVDGLDLRGAELPPLYPGGQVAQGARLGLLGNTAVMDAPFSVSSYSSTMIQDQQARTVGDLLERDPSVRSTGQAGGIVDSFFIRGFPVGEGNLGELAFDGVYGVAPNYRVFTEFAERIEVIKGPAALLYGLSPNSAVGGVINLVPKRALDEDLTRLSSSYALNSQFGSHLDLSRRLGPERRLGVRINASTQQGETRIDEQARGIDIGAIALDYQGDDWRATLDLISQDEQIDAASRPFLIDPGVSMPAAANGRTSVSQDWGRSATRDRSALLGGEYRFSPNLSLFAHAGGGRSEVARMSDQTPRIINAAGDTSSIPGYYRFEVQRYSLDAGMRLRFDTGPVSHGLTLQASGYRDELSRGIISGPAISSNIYHPQAQPKPSIAKPDTPKVSATELSGLALADTLSLLDQRLQFSLGLRKQNIGSKNFSSAGAVTSQYDKSRTTPLFGVIAKPWEQVALYYNYIEGLSKGEVAPSAASNAGQIFSPYVSRQHEVGVKLDYGSFMSTLALFQIDKPSGELAFGRYSVQGEQRNRGLELNLAGQVTGATRLLGGVTLLDGELHRSASAANRGNRPVGVPQVQANLWAEWDTPWLDGLSLTGGAIHTGRQYVDQANTQQLPAWTRFDLGARYSTRIAQHPTTVRATVQNLFDREYWSGVASYGAFSQGSARTLLLSASVDF